MHGRYSVRVALTDQDRSRRQHFAAYFKEAMRAAGYVRPNRDPDVPALARMSGISDSLLRRWLQEAGDPSLENLRRVAPALGVAPRDLWAAAGLVLPEEVGLEGEPEAPKAPPTPEDRILADDILDDADKAALIHTLHALRERRRNPAEPRRRRPA
jgi:transcriptional regulator with XRE-family HTH domain